jgi:hypothetical protein
VSPRVRVFAHSEIATECDACGVRFHITSGGACVKCRRVLCAQHLYGSWLRRLAVDFGAAAVCVTCRQTSGA